MKASSEHNRDDSAAEDEAVLESELNDLFSEEEEDGDVVANVKTPTCDYDMDPRLVEHIHAAHGLEPQSYRRTTQRLDLSISPQPVAPQTVRTVTYAYKRALCEESYIYEHCASCARSKRRSKLTDIFFPPRGTLAMPVWLGWTSSQWEAHGTLWYDAVDAALSVHTYLETYFQAGDRVKGAERELVDAEVRYRRTCQKREADDVLDDIEDAKIWAKRVSQWRSNMAADLADDSVASPSADGKRWLLYLPGQSSSEGPRNLHCSLCRTCLEAFQRYRVDKVGMKFILNLPLESRARGLWGGPEPKELRDCSYVERRILSLARVYVTISRVTLPHAGYTKKTPEVRP